ncbi:uncharacterized protein [Montipora capricornis]|uniref:uncharacterized protein n=1 Tax=Montipora capricornis TaxID=246305 RepID=UPI0035F10D58
MASRRRRFISAKCVKWIKVSMLVEVVIVVVNILFIETETPSTRIVDIIFLPLPNGKGDAITSKNTVSWKTLPEPVSTHSTQSSQTDPAKLYIEPKLKESCAERITEMDHGIVLFKNVSIRPKLARAKVLETRMERPQEEDELLKLDKGFFTMYCGPDFEAAKMKLHKSHKSDALTSWVLAFEAVSPSVLRLQEENKTFQAGQYLAVQRVEYANDYWTVIDLLDIFITADLLGVTPDKLNIILMDAHPPTQLDPFWSVLFQKLIRLGVDDNLTKFSNVVFARLTWRYPRMNCPLLNHGLKSYHLIQPFRKFVLKQFDIPSESHQRNCSTLKLHVLVNFRRNYQSHPRNLDGTVDRKITNENDVLKDINTTFPGITLTASQLDALPLKKQLELVASADIFFGMHGAAHAYPIFMPPGGAVVEMFNFNSGNWHMGKIATLAGHSHVTWTLTDRGAYNTVNRTTTIPKGIPSDLIRKAMKNICG